jgi:hypothetical protein
LWTRWWTFGFHKMLGSSWAGAQLAASQEGSSSVSKLSQPVTSSVSQSVSQSVTHSVSQFVVAVAVSIACSPKHWSHFGQTNRNNSTQLHTPLLPVLLAHVKRFDSMLRSRKQSALCLKQLANLNTAWVSLSAYAGTHTNLMNCV